ncbi:hypothetical protein RAS1_31940 [Phycisphaerae bacterium RAS1]|nr:hypothetical protein RAS1_31940 [Phycisphaerae bacterium RAS1]
MTITQTDIAPARVPAAQKVGCGFLLIVAVWVAGSPGLSSPWIAGDEMIFIANNSDVTGAGRAEPFVTRLLGVFTHVHEDLYQPIPIVTYALEWTLWGERRIEGIRRTDVLLHSLNALLVWNVLSVLLCRWQPDADARLRDGLAAALALAWALHPTLVLAYAADMGRTHLLSATFGLLALRLHIAALASGQAAGQVGWFLGSVTCLAAANLCKVLAGWPLVVLVLEAAWLGWRAALQMPRVYLVTVVSGAFAALTYETTRESGILADAELALFGDRFSRSLLGAWLYVRNIVATALVSPWHLPDPQTSYTYWPVLAGAACLAFTTAAASWAGRRRWGGAIAIGVALFWAQLLPVIGLIGARVAAAQDRYLYVPLIGAALALGAVFIRRPAAAAPAGIVIALLGGSCLPFDRHLASTARSTLQRAERVVQRNPGDPRAMEMLAAAYGFLVARPGNDIVNLAPAIAQERFRATILEASTLARADGGRYFRDTPDRAAFHRRLSFQLWAGGYFPDSLAQAELARQIQPDAPMTWVRLAFAYRSMRQYEQAAAAYARLESLMSDQTPDRALRLMEYGELLLNSLGDAPAAATRFKAARDAPDAPTAVVNRATVGLALCEIRAGGGDRGRALAESVLARDPGSVDAALAIGEYHLRSHHWDDAAKVYSAILLQDPTHYSALRGFQAVCEQTGAYRQAALAWTDASRQRPDDRALASFRVWATAVAADERAEELAQKLLGSESDNSLANLAKLLLTTRANRLDEAVELAHTVARGTPVPDASELERGEKFIRLALSRGELPSEAMLVAVALRLQRGDRPGARELLGAYQTQNAGGRWAALAETLTARCSKPD